MISIIAPNSSYKGVRAGLPFSEGRATAESLTPSQRAYFARHGYTVTGEDAEGSKPETPARGRRSKTNNHDNE